MIARIEVGGEEPLSPLIDRLETRGLVRRRPADVDRRKVLVEATSEALALGEPCYGPIAQAGAEMLARYALDELATVNRFLVDAQALQPRMTEALLERESLGDVTGREA